MAEKTVQPVEKVVVIGLDGADWRLMDPWLQDGQLPVISRLIREGARANLRSTIRPESSVAWSSFATGANPGKHGIYGFVRHRPGSYDFTLANGSHIGTSRFWDLLSAAGRRVGLLNVPFTYPPTALNGFVVSGMLTPGPHVTFAQPPQLQQAILQRYESYCFDPGETMSESEALLEAVRRCTLQQRDMALWLLQSQSWEFFAVVFTGPDRLQHFFWQQSEALLEHYRELDEALGQIVAQLSEDTLLLLMSDHGFNRVDHRFYINRWLQQEGYLATLPGSASWREHLVPLMQRLKRVQLLRRVKQRLLPDEWGPAQLQSQLFSHSLDWSGTQVYFAPDGGLRLNVQGREPQGIVPPGEAYEALRHELRDKLLALRHPASGSPVVDRVYFAEELYDGPFAAAAPDLIVEPHREQPAHNFLLDGSLPQADDERQTLFGSVAPYTANHAQEGIFVAWGAQVATAATVEASIVDLAPTILAAMDVPIPTSMDGRVLETLFRPGALPQPRYTDSPANAPQSGRDFEGEDEQIVADRLRDLGYVD